MPTTDYTNRWNRIDSLINNSGLYESALKEVKLLYNKAKTEKQAGEQIKALLYQIQLQEVLVEESDSAALHLLRTEISSEKGVSRALLNTLLADYYKKQYDRNRWAIYSRTPLADGVSDDVQSWTAPDYHRAITAAYRAALLEPALQNKDARTPYEAIIKKGENATYRPSIYELVLQKALGYFKADPVELPQQADDSFWQNPSWWKNHTDFLRLRISLSDSTEPGLISLKLYQELIRYYTEAGKQEQLATTDLKRYEYLKTKAEGASADSLYLAALASIQKSYPGTEAADHALYLSAYWQLTENEDPRKALAIANALVAQNKTTAGALLAYNLIQDIKAASLSIQTERVNIPGEPFRALVSWKNLDKIYLRLVQLDPGKHGPLLDQSRYFDSANYALLMGSTVLKSWEQTLPAQQDFKEHSTEIKIDGLPIGSYFLLASDHASFSMDKSNLGLVKTQVSNISYISAEKDYFVLHRNTGQPLAKAIVQLYQRNYDYQTRRYSRVKVDELQANDKGFVYINKAGNNNYGSFSLDIKHGDDYLRVEDQEYLYSYSQQEKNLSEEAYEQQHAQVFYFMDRNLYRPGQTIYFKAVLTSKNRESLLPYILTGKKTRIQLYNANNEKIDSIEVISNEFGSVTGKFTLPANGLTGQFYLQDESYNSSTYFSVEEYKRPRFEVRLEEVKSTIRLGDTVTINGKAIAYAGNAISNATGTYRVTRGNRYLYPWKLGRYGFSPRYKTVEITHGKLTTASDGSFSISFPAIPDAGINRSADPVFDYSISIDITDLNGETRSASNSVAVSYKSMKLSISAPQNKISANDFTVLNLSTTNLAGIPQPALVEVKIIPLKNPGKLFRPRYWEMPDTFVLTEKEYRQYFPYDLYKNEDDPGTWQTGKAVWQKTIKTDSSGLVNLDKKKFSPGWYQLVAKTVDTSGDSIEAKTVVFLTDPSGKSVAESGYLTATTGKRVLKPGEQTNIELSTEATELFVIEKRSNWKTQAKEIELPFSEKFRLFSMNKERIAIPVLAGPADKGGIQVQHVFVRHNRVFTEDSYFTVPLQEKDLKISLQTYRDKLEPGQKEKWTVALSGEEAEKFGMELLTSMYDASLDQFQLHSWYIPSIWPSLQRKSNWSGHTNFITQAGEEFQVALLKKEVNWVEDDALVGFEWVERRRMYAAGMRARNEQLPSAAPREQKEGEMDDVVVSGYISQKKTSVTGSASVVKGEELFVTGDQQSKLDSADLPVTAPTAPALRTNFNETAFFFPQLSANSNGLFSFSFTMPESVTTWKWQLFAHTKSLAMGYLQQAIITQKDLMVQPNMPRFLREGDKMEITTKVVNLTDKEVTGQAELQLIDATTNQPVDGWFRNFFPNQYFTVAAKSTELVRFPVEVPYQFDRALTWKIIARVGEKTDGESSTLPVLSNRQLVTEAIPFFINGSSSKDVPLTKLINSKDSETLSNQSLTVEFSANPAWYAIQSLPYLTEYPYECAEQSFNRLYGYLIADHLLKAAPRIKKILLEWQQKDSTAFLSNLQKNEQLKQVLLEETPWVLEAKSEAEQKKRLLLLFDASKLEQEAAKLIAKLKEMQSSNGGFSWFKGGPDDRYITQYILTGIGHLQKLGIIGADYGIFAPLVSSGLRYADQRLVEDYNKRDKAAKEPSYLNYFAVQYHYMRSFFSSAGLSGEYVLAANHYRKEIQSLWIKGNLLSKAMIALALHRTGDKLTATGILRSLQQTAIKSADKGMYWKANTGGYYWQEAPIETQALMIELFQELKQPATTINEMKAWLLLNKQTNRWSTTKATADACYALLLQGSNWLEAQPKISVKLGNITTVTATREEAGTGYYQKIIPGTAVFPEMGAIKINVEQAQAPNVNVPVWGAVYWQYFDNLENITAAKTALAVNKQVLVEKLTDKGPVLEAIQEGNTLKVGDKLVVRLEISTDRQMEYVHVKDMRASSLEPTNVLSGYRWKGSLGYYESTRDASTNFFIQYLPKGNHVLEYSLFVSHAGTFSNGISTIQCMYAPEFTSHTEGIKLNIEAN